MYELKNRLEDFRWSKKQAVVYFHWSLKDFDEADYYEMLEMMSAKDKKDRIVDPGKMFEQYQQKQQEKGWLTKKWHNKLMQKWVRQSPLI